MYDAAELHVATRGIQEPGRMVDCNLTKYEHLIDIISLPHGNQPLTVPHMPGLGAVSENIRHIREYPKSPKDTSCLRMNLLSCPSTQTAYRPQIDVKADTQTPFS